MFLTFYFPLVASSSVQDLPDGFLSKVRDGDIQQAVAQASRWSEIARGAEDSPELLRLHADMQMTLGVFEEAEEQYHYAQKAIRSSRQAIRVASCRNAGWQALFRHRPATALTCFARLLEDPDVAWRNRLRRSSASWAHCRSSAAREIRAMRSTNSQPLLGNHCLVTGARLLSLCVSTSPCSANYAAPHC